MEGCFPHAGLLAFLIFCAVFVLQLWLCVLCSLTLKQLPWDWKITLNAWCKLDVRWKGRQMEGRTCNEEGSSEAQTGQRGWGRTEPLDLQSLGFWLLQATGSTSANVCGIGGDEGTGSLASPGFADCLLWAHVSYRNMTSHEQRGCVWSVHRLHCSPADMESWSPPLSSGDLPGVPFSVLYRKQKRRF